MRHRQSGRKLNRNSAHRTAMFRNMTASLVRHELIKTTLVKAKELRGVAEPLITLARQDSVANRRLAFSRVRDRAAVGKLFAELGPRYADRPGGYIRILKCGLRPGDKAPMAYVELVDRPKQDAMGYEDDIDNTDREALPPEEAAEAEQKADKRAKAPAAGPSKTQPQPKTKAKQAAAKVTRKSAARKRG